MTIKELISRILMIFNKKPQYYKPDFYFQALNINNTTLLSHQLFGLDNVNIYICTRTDFLFPPWGYPSYTENTPENQALNTVNWIEYIKNQLLQYHPNKVFKYALWPQNFYLKNPQSITDDSLYDNPDDKIEYNGIKYKSPWHTSGIAEKAQISDRFYAKLATELKSRNLPNPIFIDPDDESVVYDVFGNGPTIANVWLNDKRSNDILFDGNQTLSTFIQNYKDLQGNPVQSMPDLYNTSQPYTSNIYSSLTYMIRDYCLYESHFKYAKKYLGESVICNNWLTYCSSRLLGGQAWSWRPKESPIDFNKSMKLDRQVPSFYGTPQIDSYELDNVEGYSTFNNLLKRYKIPNSMTIAQQLEAIYLAYVKEGLNACKLSNPNKPITMWTYLVDNAITYPSSKIQPDGGSWTMTEKNMLDTFQIAADYHIDMIGLFEPNLDMTKADIYYDLIVNKLPTIKVRT